MRNRVRYGLEKVHYAVVTEVGGAVAYGTPAPIPGAVNLTLSAAGESTSFYADNRIYFKASTNNGYEGTLEVAIVPDVFRVDVLGDGIDANGALIENANAKPKNFALMFEFEGDLKKARHVLYNVMPTRPNVDSATKTNINEPKTEAMNISATPAIDTSDVKAKVKQGDTGYDTFFSAVYLKNAPVNTLASGAETFSKAVPADILVDVTSTDAQNAVRNVLLDGLPVAGIHLTPSGVDVSIDQTVFASLDNGDYIVTVEFNRGNAVTVTVTVTD